MVGRHLEQAGLRILAADDSNHGATTLVRRWRSVGAHILSMKRLTGLEAVQKAYEVQPDVILLDISIPKLDGIAAERQIRSKCPKSKMLFVSEDRSLDVVREALSTGVQGYVVKSDGAELLAAVDAVCQGRFFVNKSLAKNSLVAADLDRARDKFRDLTRAH